MSKHDWIRVKKFVQHKIRVEMAISSDGVL